MTKNIKSLQHLMACLTTHEHYLNIALKEPKSFLQQFNLCQGDKEKFQDFLKCHSERFKAATLLLSKKRWEEVMVGLDLVFPLFSESLLKEQWGLYVASYALEQSIPVNPLQDAVQFINFILKNIKVSDIFNSLLSYQALKLELMMKIDEITIQENVSKEKKQRDKTDENFFITANQTVVIKAFNYKISHLVRDINNNKKVPVSFLDYEEDERLAFYINKDKKTVSIVTVSNYIFEILKIVSTEQSMKKCFYTLSKKYPLNEEDFKDNLLQLQVIGLINVNYM